MADTRIHGTTRRQVGILFTQAEQPALLKLPPMRFALFQEARRSVHRDGHVEVARAYYSVPPEYVGRRVWARWDARMVRVFNHRMEQIAVHARKDAGAFSTARAHIDTRKRSAAERGTTWLLKRAALLGTHTEQWSQAMLQTRGIQGIRVLVGLLHLADRHDAGAIDHACRIAHSHGAYRLRVIRTILKHGGSQQQQFALIAEHAIIRDITEYDRLVRLSLARSPVRDEP